MIIILLVTIFLSISAISAASDDIGDSTDIPAVIATGDVAVGDNGINTGSIGGQNNNEDEPQASEGNKTVEDENDASGNGTDAGNGNETANNGTDSRQSITIASSPIITYANTTITINANVTKEDGSLLNSAKVAIKINGKTIGQTRVYNGTISYDYELPKWHAKTYNLTIVVGETSKTLKGTNDFDLIIIRHDVVINMSDFTVPSATNTTLYATVNYENGSAVDGAKAVFKINGKTIASTTVKEGVVSVDYVVPTKANIYPLILKIGESTVSSYNDSTVDLIVTKRTPTVDTESLFFVQQNNTVTLRATLTDLGYANASGKIGFKINGKTVATVQMVDNTATYDYDASNLKVGNHVVSIVYGGSSALEEIRYNTTLRVQNAVVSDYTYEQILTKANLTYKFIVNNKVLPNYASMNGNHGSMADFLYLMTQVLTYKNSYHDGSFITPSSTTQTTAYDITIFEEDYMSLAKDIVDSYIKNGQAPDTIITDSDVTLSFEDAVFSYTKILSYLELNGRLPNYVTVTKINESSSSGSGSNQSGYVSTNTVPSGYESYVVSTNNTDVNNSVIITAVKLAVKDINSTYNQASAIFDYVNDCTNYTSYVNTKYGAVETLNRGTGNCADLSHLLVGMFRTANIPARYCHATCTFRSGLVIAHVWVEAYVDGKWYSCDASSSYNTFGNVVNQQNSTVITNYISLPF